MASGISLPPDRRERGIASSKFGAWHERAMLALVGSLLKAPPN